MNLTELSAGSDFGFVSGVVDVPITEQEREDGVVGHTVVEWEAYNQIDGGATRHAMRDEHNKVVGHVLHTYVDHQGRLCASGMLDMQNPDNKQLFGRVKSGEKHSFSIGYDAVPQKGTRRYKNAGMDVSLTSDPRKEFAVIKVRCSNTNPEPMTDATTEPMDTAAETPEAAAKPSPPTLTSKAPTPKSDQDEILRQLQETLKEKEEKARMWEEREAAKKEKKFRANLEQLEKSKEVLAEHGFDMSSEGQKAIAHALASSDRSGPLVAAMSGVSQQLLQERREKADLKRRLDELEARNEVNNKVAERSTNVLDWLRQVTESAGGERKRPVASPSTSTKLSDSAADILGLGSLDMSLFQKASSAHKAAESKPAAVQQADMANQLVAVRNSNNSRMEEDEPEQEMFAMPTDPKERLALAFKCLEQPQMQMPQVVRCSAGQEGFLRPDVEKVLRTRPTAFGGRCHMSDATIQLFFADKLYWQTRAEKLDHNAWTRDGSGNTRDYSHLKRQTNMGHSELWSVGIPN